MQQQNFEFFPTETLLIAGVDEAGRGPLAGPVLAAAVILDPNKPIAGLADSKKLTANKRDRLYDIICRDALAFAIAEASVEEIDRLNILHASLLAMQRAVEQLPINPELALIDGNRCPKLPCAARAIVKGDATEPAISAASILAKVTRDRLLLQYEALYPGYGFAEHKGYPTASHIKALAALGALPIHRRSFGPVREILQRSEIA